MSTLRRTVRNHPLIVFVVLACLFGWGSSIAVALGFGSNPDNMPLGPLMAALVVTACQGGGALRRWGRALRSWRCSPVWYVAVILAPVAIHVTNVMVNHGFGAPLPTGDQLSAWTDVPGSFLFMLLLVGIGEEAGWTAFAAPLLLRRHSLVTSWLLLSAVRILWHLPLMLNGEMSLTVGILGNAGFQLVILLMMRATQGQWTLAAVWHASLNATGGQFLFRMVGGDDHARLGVLLGVAYVVIGLVWAIRTPGIWARAADDESLERLETVAT